MKTFEELDAMEIENTNTSKKTTKKVNFFLRLAYCWINTANICR